jgi:3-oxoadipate enol-lactonase
MAAISDAVIARWVTSDFAAREPATFARLKGMLEEAPAAGYAAACAAVRDCDERAHVADIAAPVLVIAGTHDLATPPADGRFLAGAIRGAGFVELPAAHLSNIEAAAAFTAAAARFLRQP